jgi:hypothetical protein
MYKLFTDKSELFECSINLEGASLNQSIARILIESEDYNLVFNGKIDSNGKCQIPIKKLKGLLPENSKGNIKLEVIAEDTYFVPWKSDYHIDASKKVTVEVKKQDKPLIEPKPRVSVRSINNNSNDSDKIHINRLSHIFIRENITLNTFPKNKQKVNKIIEIYSSKYQINPDSINYIIDGVLSKL